MADPIIIVQPEITPEDLDDALAGNFASKKMFTIPVYGSAGYIGSGGYEGHLTFHIHPRVDMRLVTLTSRMHADEYRFNMFVNRKMVLQDEDPSAFNLRELVPMMLGGPIRLGQAEIPPIQIDACVFGSPSVSPPFNLTLWGQCLGDAHVEHGAPTPELLRTLRALKSTGTAVDDAEIARLMDKYARWL